MTAYQPPTPAQAHALERIRAIVDGMTCPCGFTEKRARKEPCACSFGAVSYYIEELLTACGISECEDDWTAVASPQTPPHTEGE